MSNPRKILFIDRDGTLIKETTDEQIDSFEKLEFYPGVLQYMPKIAAELDFELVMVTNQDGLGTASFPEDTFWPLQNLVMKRLEGEGIRFSAVYIDKSFPKDNKPTRKPGTGMLTQYLDNEEYDLENSYVIGDRITDVQLAKNLGCQAIWLNNDASLGSGEIKDKVAELQPVIALETTSWSEIYEYLRLGLRQVIHERNTSETQIKIDLKVDGRGKA